MAQYSIRETQRSGTTTIYKPQGEGEAFGEALRAFMMDAMVCYGGYTVVKLELLVEEEEGTRIIGMIELDTPTQTC